MKWITGLFGFIKGAFNSFATTLEIIKLLKSAWNELKEAQERARREKFKEGVAGKDTKKVEESFDSNKAGKPDAIGEIEWDDEKTK